MKRIGLIVAMVGCLASTSSPDGVNCKAGAFIENKNPDCTGGG
jgi:hypothetical protein